MHGGKKTSVFTSKKKLQTVSITERTDYCENRWKYTDTSCEVFTMKLVVHTVTTMFNADHPVV